MVEFLDSVLGGTYFASFGNPLTSWGTCWDSGICRVVVVGSGLATRSLDGLLLDFAPVERVILGDFTDDDDDADDDFTAADFNSVFLEVAAILEVAAPSFCCEKSFRI